ncbi:class I SAM-dependent methyltransferase [Corallococcus sicarius]|uniref:Class I SAM-dependent methyltransferase n=1 Tax=Corallococcus sicarius TaxID=2316726 RepID=A0A3A8N914_9BACT|nr:class I SAM-dependent methyltransferase [Corallococcus sicarius]RKH37625.1 class I SAM-dependent methyltransferase [Corallococcus sicarius]
MDKATRDAATARVRDFYDGPADTIYKTTWGENLHLGLPRAEGDSQQHAMVHTTERMAAAVRLDANTRVLDLGSGYGGPARQLAEHHGCHVVGLNLSPVEIAEAERQTQTSKARERIRYAQGDFHELPFEAETFDIVWSQDSLMYGADKPRILREAFRVLKPGGAFDFTDILANHGLSPEQRERLYARVRTPEMWDVNRYAQELIAAGFMLQRIEDWSEHVAASYAAARAQTLANRGELTQQVGDELINRTLDGLAFWVDMAQRGNVGWALFVARKPSGKNQGE